METKYKLGQTVEYKFYGKTEQSEIVRISGNGTIVYLANGRWMHATSCTPVNGEENA